MFFTFFLTSSGELLVFNESPGGENLSPTFHRHNPEPTGEQTPPTSHHRLKFDYSITLLGYPIIQNKSDQTTYYSCCYYHLSQIHHYFMTPLTFYCHTNPLYLSHLGSRSHLQITFLT